MTIALSVLLHTGAMVLRVPEAASSQILKSELVRAATPRPRGDWKLVEPASPQQIAAARRHLVQQARLARQHGNLRLGAFLLRAAEIDAAELGIALDIQEAEQRYERALARFQGDRERRGLGPALREAYGDMHYQSIGGNIADALLERAGSCEQLTHLVVATLYDAGLADHVFVRYYGGGTPHLAPIYVHGPYAFDLVLGSAAQPGGAQFPAADLIEVYARKHGLADGRVAGGPPPRWSDGRSTFAGGYPPNDDGFGRAVPLFAEDVFANGAGARSAANDFARGDDDAIATGCPLHWWDRLGRTTVGVLSSEGAYAIELIDTTAASAQYLAAGLARWEIAEERKQGRAERIIQHACLALGYEKLAVDLAWLGRPALAQAAQKRSLVSRKEVERLAAPALSIADRKQLANGQDAWVLTVLPDPLVLVDELFDGLPGGSQLLWALLENDATHDAAVQAIEQRPFFDRFVTVMAVQPEPETRWRDLLPPDSDLGRARHAWLAVVLSMREIKPQLDNDDWFLDALLAEGFPPSWASELRRLERKVKELQQTEPNLPPEELYRRLRTL